MSSELDNKQARVHAIKLALVGALFLGCWSGCGVKGAGTLPSLIPVKGKVTFKGEPLTSGTIHFEPDDFGRPATGKLQSDGTFVLTTLKQGDGVVPGHHKVSITETDRKTKTFALLKKYANSPTFRLEADVSADKTEFAFDIP
jgi:hypothetical protein